MAEPSLGLQLAADHLVLVRSILQRHIPGYRVWAFGSRATGHLLKRFSDLDLAVEGELTWEQRANLSEAFEESLLPMKVDVVETKLLDPDFHRRIAGDFMPVQPAGESHLFS